jgi:predicted ATP-grasp superfamily ATP-dependent carboligase
MRILVYEYITGGGLNAVDLPHSLAREGDLMLQALLRDLTSVPDAEVWVCRDARLPLRPDGDNVRLLPVHEGCDMLALFDTWMSECDAVWPIAPETGALLESLCTRVQAAGKLLLTSSAEAVRICGDKLRTFELLQQHAIPAVASWPLPGDLPEPNRRWVVKARDGAGCADSAIVATAAEYRSVKSALSDPDNFILQAFTPGKPVSLSGLFKHGEVSLLSYNEQQIAVCGRHFELQGCIVNAPCSDWARYRQLIARVARALPALWGYAGVDLLETPDGPLVLEINPRLTTSYAGLRQALRGNIARQVVDLLHAGLPQTVRHGRPVAVAISQERADGG